MKHVTAKITVMIAFTKKFSMSRVYYYLSCYTVMVGLRSISFRGVATKDLLVAFFISEQGSEPSEKHL